MRKAGLLSGLVMVAAVAGGSFTYGWYSVTRLAAPPRTEQIGQTGPSDIGGVSVESDLAPVGESQPEPSSEPTAPTSAHQQISMQQYLANFAGENSPVSVSLDETHLNQLVNDAIQSQPQAAQILSNARSIQTMLRRDRIEIGAVFNLSELPRDGLPADAQAGIDQLTAVAPMFSNRDIYVGLVAHPQVQDGKVSLNQDLSFRVGQFTLPLADVANQIGISSSDIEEGLNTLLDQQGLTLNSIELLDEQLVITGTKP